MIATAYNTAYASATQAVNTMYIQQKLLPQLLLSRKVAATPATATPAPAPDQDLDHGLDDERLHRPSSHIFSVHDRLGTTAISGAAGATTTATATSDCPSESQDHDLATARSTKLLAHYYQRRWI